jgi:hypothetical protein
VRTLDLLARRMAEIGVMAAQSFGEMEARR